MSKILPGSLRFALKYLKVISNVSLARFFTCHGKSELIASFRGTGTDEDFSSGFPFGRKQGRQG